MRAYGRDLDLQSLVSEAPFDEGRSQGILRSSAENLLSGVESQPMRSPVRGHRKGPADLAAGITNQEEQVSFQVLKQVCHERRIEPESFGDVRGTQRAAMIPRQLPDHKISYGMVMPGHEGKTIGHFQMVPRYIGRQQTGLLVGATLAE